MTKKTKYIQLNNGKSTLALESSYWNQIEYLADKDGYGNWREWFYANHLWRPDEGLSVAAYVRMKVAMFLFDDLGQRQSDTTGIS